MGPEHSVQLESIFRYMSVGVAIIDCSNWRIRYANPYLLSLLDQLQLSQVVIGRRLDEVIPEDLWVITHPFIEQVCATGRRMSWPDIPYEGFLARRGRTSWRGTIERTEVQEPDSGRESDDAVHTILVTIEDVTELARSRLYVNAIDSISSAIVGPFALPLVLERILHAVQEMVGSTRCAILLIDDWEAGSEYRYAGPDGRAETYMGADKPSTVSIAAQKGVHLRSQDWHPQLSEQLLLGLVARDRSTLIINDTSTIPEMKLPLLDDGGTPRRPGSVLCIPIFEPTADNPAGSFTFNGKKGPITQRGAVLGTIEVYHRRARGFPAEEVELLEQFAQQAGLAIQNARLFLHINRLARDASRNLRQREHIMQAIPDGVIIYDSRWRVADANHAIRKFLGWSTDVIGLAVA